jgi:hypothetical protein
MEMLEKRVRSRLTQRFIFCFGANFPPDFLRIAEGALTLPDDAPIPRAYREKFKKSVTVSSTSF